MFISSQKPEDTMLNSECRNMTSYRKKEQAGQSEVKKVNLSLKIFE